MPVGNWNGKPAQYSSWLDGFGPTALVLAKLGCRETGPAGTASPTGKRTADKPGRVRARRVLARAHRQNQLTTTIRTFTFLHSPFEPLAAHEQPFADLPTMSQIPGRRPINLDRFELRRVSGQF